MNEAVTEKADNISMERSKSREAGLEPALIEDNERVVRKKAYLTLTPFMDGIRELRTPHIWRDVICEVLVTFLLIFFNCAIGFNFATLSSPSTPLIIAGIGSGVYVSALIEGFGHIQLCSMNPAVTIFFTLTGKLSIIKGLLYISAECLGSVLGVALVYSCAPSFARANLRPLSVHPGVNPLHGLIIEWVITTSLILVTAGSLDERNRKVYMPGLPIGLSVVAGILCAGQFTGGSLNPMITFGPAVVSGVWKNQWVYWAGPLLGGFTGTLLYHGFTYDRGVFTKDSHASQATPTKCKQGDYVACAANEPNQNNNARQRKASC